VINSRGSRREDIVRWGNRLLFLLNLALLAVATWFVGTRGLDAPTGGWTYQELVATLLTAIGVLLAIVAFFVALLAIWGYNSLKESASTVAAARAEIVADRVAREVAGPIAARVGAEASNTVDDDGGTQDGGGDLAQALKEGS